MEVHRLFEELYECAEKHDQVGFNRALYWLLREETLEGVEDDVYDMFIDTEYCLDCDNKQPTKIDQMIIDGQPLYLKVCQDCGIEMELD